METRALEFSATFNFRDLGGYPGLDGRPVRWRRLFRSDSLHRLSAADREAFGALGVRTVVDLRRPREVTRDGRVHPFDGLAYHHIHPEHAEWTHSEVGDDDALARWLADRYLDLARDGVAGIGRALAVVADERAAPVVVHCVAGKDRTGVVCALTLALLGVSDDDIAADYALSTAASARFSAWLRSAYPDDGELPAPFLASPAQTMRLFLADLRSRHGSIDEYARAAGITTAQVDAMRTHLLVG
ncbi:MAG TPA: tyrosine-protein phosphatase [Pilimelia sp.]|nr:tyrosine-protein phosphatase [Pilimelia sp.]